VDRLTLVTNPADDQGFADEAERLVVQARSPDELERLLRASYPAVIVRRRELSGEPTQTWYVYRDGRWTASGATRAAPGETTYG
jgi:hypothetical protein